LAYNEIANQKGIKYLIVYCAILELQMKSQFIELQTPILNKYYRPITLTKILVGKLN